MPITESVIKQVEKLLLRMGQQKNFLLRTGLGIEYDFDNDEEYEMLAEPEDAAPYPDIPAKALGMLTECEEEFEVNNVVQEEMEQTDKKAEYLGLDFSSVPKKVMGGELIEILDNEEEEAINKYMQEEILMKVEPNQKKEVL
jgi:hypothetical protein